MGRAQVGISLLEGEKKLLLGDHFEARAIEPNVENKNGIFYNASRMVEVGGRRRVQGLGEGSGHCRLAPSLLRNWTPLPLLGARAFRDAHALLL